MGFSRHQKPSRELGVPLGSLGFPTDHKAERSEDVHGEVGVPGDNHKSQAKDHQDGS